MNKFAIRRENGTFFTAFVPSKRDISKFVPMFTFNNIMTLQKDELKETVKKIKKFYKDIEIVTIDVTPIPKV